MADGTLKLCGEPQLPGLALPKAFDALQLQLESVADMCKLRGSHEAQTTGMLLVCEELQRLLRLSFIENGILAKRIEILARYQDDYCQKYDKRLKNVEIERNVTRKFLKKLRKRQYNYETIRRAHDKESEWWRLNVSCSDYDTINNLSRTVGCPDLEFMLRINQIMLDFVKDKDTTELLLPPMGNDERAGVSKLASLYKLRCRFNKSTQVATSTIIKARQTCVPASGEVDSLLTSFTKKVKDSADADAEAESPKEIKDDSETLIAKESTPPLSATNTSQVKEQSSSSSSSSSASASVLPLHMLTPVSGPPTITLENEPSTTAASTSKTTDTPTITNTLPSPSVRVTKIEQQRSYSGASGGTTLLQLLPDTTTNTTTTNTLSSLASVMQKSPQVVLSNAIPSYSNLISSASSLSSPSNSALQMALLMQQHQQLRALTAAAAAVGNQSSSGAVTPPNTGISTVLATPLPPSFSTPSSTGDGGGRGSMKREHPITAATKRTKFRRTND